MVTIIVAAHGESAPALLKTASMILGNLDNVYPVTFLPGQGPEDLIEEYTRIVAETGSEETLILVDLFGGSPYNAAARFAAGRDDADVVTGVNLPMVIEVLSRRLAGAGLAELVEAARTSATDGVKVLSEVFTPARTTTSDDEGDEL